MILLYPVALMLLLPLLAVTWWFMHPQSVAGTRLPGSWHKVVTPALRDYLGHRLRDTQDRSAMVVATCALLAILTLAHPVMTKQATPPQNFKARVVVLDMSPGAAVEQQRFVVDSLLQETSSSAMQGPTATGLVLVSGGAYSIVPVTEDMAHIQRYLNVATPELMPQGGRALHEGIAVAETMLEDSGVVVGQVVLITSGRAVEKFIAIPDRGRLRDLVVTEGTEGNWLKFSEWYGATVYSGTQSGLLDKRLESAASEKLFRGVQSASTDVRPVLIGLAAMLWLWLFRRRTRT